MLSFHDGFSLEETLTTYQQLWDQVETIEQKTRTSDGQDRPTEIRYDAAVVREFITRLPDILQADVRLGREFLQETLQHVRIEDGERRLPCCPICGEEQGKISPQHLKTHGLALSEAYRSFPGLGFTKKARLIIQPSPNGILNTLKEHCSLVAGAGFEPATFGLCLPLQLSLPG
ncbi:MAG: hypothetical protein C3F08_05580 [Candidatus Methylomirabilota bacterium]|nr:MAG: hypothetical protein C3F08_05580 [candidate division NC10 bacterium]